jgi:uncharacterized protein YjbJ (UPF0337 family)
MGDKVKDTVSDTGRFNDKVDQASGKTKEWAGRTQHGIAETKENARDMGDKVKDAVSDTAHKVKDAFRR